VTPPPPSARYGEDASVEQPAIELFKELGWDHLNAFHETFGPDGAHGRETKAEVFLTRFRRPAIERLNLELPREGIEAALTEATRVRSALHHARANREVYELLRDRVAVSIRKPDGSKVTERVTLIDWETPENNDFLLVSQLRVTSDLYGRRTDLLGFINGIPLVFIELKAAHRNLKHAYDDNLRDYRDVIPHLFIPNGFIVLSNGAETSGPGHVRERASAHSCPETPLDALGPYHETDTPQPDAGRSDRAIPETARRLQRRQSERADLLRATGRPEPGAQPRGRASPLRRAERRAACDLRSARVPALTSQRTRRGR